MPEDPTPIVSPKFGEIKSFIIYRQVPNKIIIKHFDYPLRVTRGREYTRSEKVSAGDI